MENNRYKRAAFLVRCSTDKQDYERQLQDLEAVAEYFYLTISEDNIFGEYITGKDDTTKMDRLSIVRLKKAAKAGRFDVLLVAEVSRMSRDSVSGRVYVREFCNMGIPIYFRDKRKWTISLETGLEDESFIKELGLYFDGAAEYLKSMKTQVASGRRRALRNNQLVVGHPPIGYKKRGGSDRRTKSELVIDEKIAPIVKDIFAMYMEDGATLKSVALAITAKYAEELNHKPKSVSGIFQILARKEYYTGEYTIYMNDPDNKEKEPEPFTVTFEPLIDQETYEAVTKKREKQRNSRTPYPQQQVHFLTKILKCPHCRKSFSPRHRSGDHGEKYRMVNGKVSYMWMCMTRINNSGDCISHVNLSGEKTDAFIWDFIKKELVNYADLEKDTREEKILQLERQISEAQKQIPMYQQELDRTDGIVKRAYNAYINAPEIAADMALKNYNETLAKVQKDKDEYTDEIQRLKEKIESCQNSIVYFSQSNITPEYIASIEHNEPEKRKLLLQVVEKIVPYGITPGIVVLEVHSINGLYYILHNGHLVGKKRIAYYVPAPFAVWHPTTEGELLQNEKDSYFTIKNSDVIEGAEELDPTHVTFNEMIGVCEANDWALPYNYIYEQAQER